MHLEIWKLHNIKKHVFFQEKIQMENKYVKNTNRELSKTSAFQFKG